MSPALDRGIRAAKSAIKALEQSPPLRTEARDRVREAFKLGDAEGISRPEVCKRLGKSRSWLYELAGIKVDPGAQRAKTVERKRKARKSVRPGTDTAAPFDDDRLVVERLDKAQAVLAQLTWMKLERFDRSTTAAVVREDIILFLEKHHARKQQQDPLAVAAIDWSAITDAVRRPLGHQIEPVALPRLEGAGAA
jgi:hypothetical protein